MLLSRTPVTSEPISLTETSDELSSPNTQPCEVDGVDLSIISDDVSVDPVPSFAKCNYKFFKFIVLYFILCKKFTGFIFFSYVHFS